MTASDATSPSPYRTTLRRLYLVRFVFAAAWAIVVLVLGMSAGAADPASPLLIALLVVYPLFDAGAVLWQLRSTERSTGTRVAEGINVAVSVVVAAALGWAATVSVAAALAVWGAWAIAAGLPQLVVALRRRSMGGQWPQILSGGLSVLVGAAFLIQGLRGSGSLAGAGGYALFGGILFLVSALRLGRARA
jgi:uncharacterized membrane protein HdeD (DUF308 family)